VLKTPLLHPEILQSLASAGHGSQVLIADSNYPVRTHSNPDADLVFLNLAPGKLGAVEVLEAIAGAIPIEAAAVMFPDTGIEPPIQAEFRAALADQLPELERVERFAFYDRVREWPTALVIATGEQRVYANILLTIGVVKPE
jgi:L-fucose mutarotase